MSVKHETITVSGTVLYCDGCGKRGPESAYDNYDDCIEQAEMDGWTQDDEDRELCKECSDKTTPKKTTPKKRHKVKK